MKTPDLSVVVPVLEDAEALVGLLAGLRTQQGLAFEVLVAEGGEGSGIEPPRRAADAVGPPVRRVRAAPGRGRQMNAAVREARAPDLLFLHADSVLEDPGTLARARQRMDGERSRRGSFRVAGHFGLRFVRSRPGRDGAYYFYEAKTRLNRPEVINGDQGLWLARAYFEELGGFDESLPYLEDARLARRIDETGAWVALPGTLGTSARRFETEGLPVRQTLNALVRNFDAIGMTGFFARAADAYRLQGRAARLRLGPFLRAAERESRSHGAKAFARWWWGTAGYVASNAWQLAFALDCRRNRRAGLPPGQGPTPWLDRYDRRVGPLARSAPGRIACLAATGAWFYGSLLLSR